MHRQQFKDALFAINRYAVIPNLIWKQMRYARRAGKGERFKVHLGCGSKYFEGMINADANLLQRIDLWLDLKNRLPFPDGSVEFLYCSHTLEHLFPDDAIAVLREIRRVLADGGVARIAVPSFERALRIAAGEEEMKFPREFGSHSAQAINYLFCEGQHKYGYSGGVLEAFAKEAGFGTCRVLDDPSSVEARTYSGITVTDEPPGSLVAELQRAEGAQNRGETA